MTHLLLVVIYLAFIALGLPDSLLGNGWPVMHQDFGVPLSYAGVVSTIIALGTIVASLTSERITRRLGAGKVTVLSIFLTAIGLVAFCFSNHFWQLCFWAIPYGLGAGGVDAALNNYVALYYRSHHMNWLHSMWGIGATTGPFIMGWALAGRYSWHGGYFIIGVIQAVIVILLFCSLPLWKQEQVNQKAPKTEALSPREVMAIRGSKEIMAAFFCYCAIEQTTGLWAASYLVFKGGLPEEMASRFAGFFFMGIMFGRMASGFLSFKCSDTQMIRIGCAGVFIGLIAILMPFGGYFTIVGLILLGLGCAPIYPAIVHSIPGFFGRERSQAVMGVQVAGAYVGLCVMPPLFGPIANHISVGLLPVYLLILAVIMAVSHEKLQKIKS
ncbi:MAG: MFS transporter [Anaerotignum sp.]|nr:MFS transporter [Anaerotignum sp.]